MHRTIRLVAVAALLTATVAARAVELNVDKSHFTVDGKPTFLLGISYYGALGASKKFIRADLDQMQRLGINWIRVWATWSAFGNDVSAVDAEGRPRQPYLDKLKWLVTECDRRGMVVDVTLTRGEGRLGHAHVSALDAHRRALQTLAAELKHWRNWYFDMANEHNIRSRRVASKYVSMADARKLRDSVKKADPQRLATISFVRDATRDDIKSYLLDVRVDFLSPHRPRHKGTAAETEKVTRQYLAWTHELGRVVPVHYQEPFRRDFTKGWQPAPEDFVADLKAAMAGGAAGWCFHNGDNRWADDGRPRRSFDMRRQRLFDQLTPAERQALEALARTLAAQSP